MLLSGEQTDCIDLRILRWSNQNQADAITVIEAELQSCARVVRFEFYQKMIVLNFWLNLIRGQDLKSDTYN